MQALNDDLSMLGKSPHSMEMSDKQTSSMDMTEEIFLSDMEHTKHTALFNSLLPCWDQ